MLTQLSCSSETNQQHSNETLEMPLQQQNELIQLALKCLEGRLKCHSMSLASPDDARDFLRLSLAQEKNEVFAVLFLDAKHQVLAFEKLFFGTIDKTSIHPRIGVQRALAHNAAAVIFAHNHPSGHVEPSSADKIMTDQLKHILKVIDVNVLDHFIVSVEGAFSFAEHGLL